VVELYGPWSMVYSKIHLPQSEIFNHSVFDIRYSKDSGLIIYYLCGSRPAARQVFLFSVELCGKKLAVFLKYLLSKITTDPEKKKSHRVEN